MDLFFIGKSDDSLFAAMESATNAITSVIFVCGFEISMESSYLVETKFFMQKNVLTLKFKYIYCIVQGLVTWLCSTEMFCTS